MGRRVFVGTVPGGLGGINFDKGVIEAAELDGNLTLTPNGIGEVVITGNTQIQTGSSIKFFDDNDSNFVALKSPNTVSTNVTFNLPAADGSNGQVITTNGSGTLSFSSPSLPITDETASASAFYPSMTSSTSGSATGITITSSKLSFVPNTGTLTATVVTGGTVTSTGDISADSGTISSKVYSFGTEFSNGNSGTTKTIDWNNGQKQVVTMTGNCTFSFSAPPGTASFILRLVQDATGGRTANWPSSVHWADNTKPTLTTGGNSVDIISFYYNGTTYYGQAGLNFRQV